ncbi:MAG: hypothetical protein A2744_02320 [Candidatus Buchananbacteria bacterium RIFCSPHIGHO2_01_FULL_44_11]|uniref:Nudix hydrolase domain-containing protein n=1 Tax=Candidatus Buchananbacteria bacterium RIFCSPHIGHO2_01_FULL_44_11 TaxID=1797535 RepID=A0A1G1XZV1_9BACT|nr:MAG: hypothetical protein A2744_02320 [Candidatus Buchananbacteria bacterium RIFCSPHIGHO2_01_FULL_44_11]
MRPNGEKTDVGTIVSEETVFGDGFLPVIKRVVRTPDGQTREPQLLWDRTGKEFVVAVAIGPDDKFVLVKEPKYGQMEYSVGPAIGAIKQGEDIINAAGRVLLAETGYKVERWYHLITGTVIEIPDKSDGGGHHLMIGINAVKKREPESGCQVILASRQAVEDMLWGRSSLRIDRAMGIAAMFLAIQFLADRNLC